jgi:hypothetical protein
MEMFLPKVSMFSGIDLNDMTFEEYLNVCRMKEDSYIMALRSSIVRDQIFLKRLE